MTNNLPHISWLLSQHTPATQTRYSTNLDLKENVKRKRWKKNFTFYFSYFMSSTFLTRRTCLYKLVTKLPLYVNFHVKWLRFIQMLRVYSTVAARDARPALFLSQSRLKGRQRFSESAKRGGHYNTFIPYSTPLSH